MKKKYIKMWVTSFFALVFTVACGGCGGGSSSSSSGDSYQYEEDEIVPISIKDEQDSEKVITAGFEIPDSPVEDKQKFTLPMLVSDNMLLQANVVTRVWGKVSESGDVAVQIIRDEGTFDYYGSIDEKGNFLVYIGGQDYVSSCSVRIVTQSGICTTLQNVAFGELWIGAGQSNMGWAMGQCYGTTTKKLLYETDIASSADSELRLFGVSPCKSTSDVLFDEVNLSFTGGWKEAEPNVVSGFSACAYFFAREIREKYGIPVGIIQSCMGGTGVYTWMPQSVAGEALDTDGSLFDKANASEYFNGMIYPIRNAVPRGVLWYQGENQYQNYAHNYSLVIRGWRELYGKNVFFSTVQLPRYTNAQSYWLCREEQKKASLENDYCTYSVNIDLGLFPENAAEGDSLNSDGIHPYDKKPVGIRLAHATMREFYGARGTWTHPVLKSAEVSGNKIILTFDNVGKGLTLVGGAGFEIGEEGKQYVVGVPEVIAPNKISVAASGISNPVKVRYGLWNVSSDCAECVSLYNTKGDGEIAYPAEQFTWNISENQ